jgi:hypothetical protein
MPWVHIVEPGECLASIARHYGVADYRVIYDHDLNEELRRARPNPHVLHPGDRIVIPESDAKAFRVPTDRTHVFEVKRPKVFLRLDVLGHAAGTGVQARYELRLDDATEAQTGTIGADGRLDVAVAASAMRGELTLLEVDTDEIIDVIEIRIGGLDPVTTTSGLRSRLRRLGFDCGDRDGEELDELTRNALAFFQRVHEIDEAGEPGAATQAKLVELTGT